MRWHETPTRIALRFSPVCFPICGGRELNEVGDQVGTLYELWEVIGTQETLNIANDEVDEGTIFDQIPSPGTPLDEIERWTLYVSAGGPVVEFEDLPLDVARFAEQLPGFDTSEPLVAKGGAYKSDRWLFSLNCGAVDAAYRTFRDARYDTACPGDVQVGPDFPSED